MFFKHSDLCMITAGLSLEQLPTLSEKSKAFNDSTEVIENDMKMTLLVVQRWDICGSPFKYSAFRD